jgi:DNA-binding Lrp family transcriptional regulator
LLRTEIVSIHNERKKTQYDEIRKQLSEANIRILSAMWKYGPRNLLEISRKIGMPFTSVYHRIERIESQLEEITLLTPNVAKCGLIRVAVLVTASPGREEEVTRALKTPNIWRTVGLCEGNFTHISIQLVPLKFVTEFRAYIQELVDRKLITNFSLIFTGDYIPNFPDFNYYNHIDNTWRFDWEGWFASLGDGSDPVSLDDPKDYSLAVSKRDLMVVRELEFNGRKTLVDIGLATGMTTHAVKYHFDKLVQLEVVKDFRFRVHPFPTEGSAYHMTMLEFASKVDLEKFFSIVPKIFFVLGASKVLRRNAVMLETWMLESHLQRMFAFFSEMAKAGYLKSYSTVRMDWGSRKTQTISDELFDDEKTWVVDFQKCTSELPEIEKVEVTS